MIKNINFSISLAAKCCAVLSLTFFACTKDSATDPDRGNATQTIAKVDSCAAFADDTASCLDASGKAEKFADDTARSCFVVSGQCMDALDDCGDTVEQLVCETPLIVKGQNNCRFDATASTCKDALSDCSEIIGNNALCENAKNSPQLFFNNQAKDCYAKADGNCVDRPKNCAEMSTLGKTDCIKLDVIALGKRCAFHNNICRDTIENCGDAANKDVCDTPKVREDGGNCAYDSTNSICREQITACSDAETDKATCNTPNISKTETHCQYVVDSLDQISSCIEKAKVPTECSQITDTDFCDEFTGDHQDSLLDRNCKAFNVNGIDKCFQRVEVGKCNKPLAEGGAKDDKERCETPGIVVNGTNCKWSGIFGSNCNNP